MLRILLLALVALACQAAPAAEDLLYKNVLIGDFDSACAQSKELEKKGNGQIIAKVVDRLVDEGQRNVIDFAYTLWSHNVKDIVKQYFPLSIRAAVGQHDVKLIGKRDNMVLKLDANIDGMGDRKAFGDANHMIGDRMAWKLVPVEGSRLHFKIYNAHTNQYLKLTVSTDSDGDHAVYGDSRSDTHRHQFYLVPALYQKEVLFYIFNREYQQALKLSRAVDSYGDRQVFSENGKVIGDPYAFGWIVAPL